MTIPAEIQAVLAGESDGCVVTGDSLLVMPTIADESVDSIVTDPPYGLRFMGKDWDRGVPGIAFWLEAFRVLKPGGYLLAFGGTRTHHRLVCAIEDAGFEIRDEIQWLYGSGFPKSLDLSKAIDKAAGAEREITGPGRRNGVKGDNEKQQDCLIRPGGKHDETAPATGAARQWQGFGTALKPACEPICLARKPLSEKTVAANVLKWGTGAINVDGCRVGVDPAVDDPRLGGKGTWSSDKMAKNVYEGGYAGDRVSSSPKGRWPANVIHDGRPEVLGGFPQTKSGAMKKPYKYTNTGTSMGEPVGETRQIHNADSGSAARFFYCAKASRAERDAGLEDMPAKQVTCRPNSDDEENRGVQERLHGRKGRNTHPTVKPLKLMRYLCRLVTPPGGIVLDIFLGSGTTAMAAKAEGFRFIGIEKEAEHAEIARNRLANTPKPLFVQKPTTPAQPGLSEEEP